MNGTSRNDAKKVHADWKRLCLKATEDEAGKLTERADVHSCNEHNPAELF